MRTNGHILPRHQLLSYLHRITHSACHTLWSISTMSTQGIAHGRLLYASNSITDNMSTQVNTSVAVDTHTHSHTQWLTRQKHWLSRLHNISSHYCPRQHGCVRRHGRQQVSIPTPNPVDCKPLQHDSSHIYAQHLQNAHKNEDKKCWTYSVVHASRTAVDGLITYQNIARLISIRATNVLRFWRY